MNAFDVIIMATKEKIPLLQKTVPYCVKNIKTKKIYIIASKSIAQDINQIGENITFVDEESIYKGLNIGVIADIIERRCNVRERAGWYLQQFLKMAWAYRCTDKCYVSLDADTFVLNPLEYINDGKYLFTQKVEYHEPYFNTIKVLFDDKIRRCVNFSFIAENMIFDCKVMREMIRDIESNNMLNGSTFYEKIMNAIAIEDLIRSGFSEFETYGNYIFTKHPEMVQGRKLRTMRESLVLIGSEPADEQLDWAAKDYDLISIEAAEYKKTVTVALTKQKWFRNCISMRTLAIMRHKMRTIYRKLLKKKDFKFEDYI